MHRHHFLLLCMSFLTTKEWILFCVASDNIMHSSPFAAIFSDDISCIRHYYFFLCMSFLTTKCHFRSCMSFLITKAGTTVRCIRHLSCMSFLTTKDSMIFSVLGNAGRVVFAKRKGRVGCSAQASKIYSGKNLLHKYLSGNTFFYFHRIYPKICIVFSRFSTRNNK